MRAVAPTWIATRWLRTKVPRAGWQRPFVDDSHICDLGRNAANALLPHCFRQTEQGAGEAEKQPYISD